MSSIAERPTKSSGNNGSSTSTSTIPVNRPWQDPLLDRGQPPGARSSTASHPVGRWLTEPSWQEPFNTIAEVPADDSKSRCAGGDQGSGAAASYATSRTQQHE
nr:uncharacterized protein CTRU02_05966 [Colletotrichum truncatum]KAF6793094.1 hypothetical protein CTRU02_05966 [Colletotrichum truncatum]